MGRKSSFTKKVGDEICLRISQGESLRSICRDESMPPKVTVLRWLLSDQPLYSGFRAQYAQAREIQRHGYEDEIIDIADDGSNDWVDRECRNGDTIRVVDHEHIQRSKERIDARKWVLGRMEKRKERGEGQDKGPQKIELVIAPKPSKPSQ